ncbi:FCD domain-containing protein [Phreatobacter aquaticus]|uniref:FCD domain-containing protein n=1 Tax=Phreatobacter aquaticus TaxID=2570229 RepID=A0A4D7QSL7_9HYPH|nr:FCD domain-containing protein [Phreatobacter aquaticus]QCK88419.1 FCD domain-containing protein [Phreatobacter aquaticus]
MAAKTEPKATEETRAGDVLHRMRLDIISCTLKPGTRLRFEALKELYAVSFSTLREALSRLVAEGLVLSEGQRGFMVAPLYLSDLEDLTNVRVLVDQECISRSIIHGDDDWEAEIMAAFHRMDRLKERLGDHYFLSDEWSVLHGGFHRSLVNACQSPTLLDFRDKLFQRANRYQRMSCQFRTKWRPKDVEHRTLMEAIIARDAVGARSLIERHMRETTENVIQYAGQFLSPEPVGTWKGGQTLAAE